VRCRTPERGQTSLLIVGFAVVAVLLVVVVVDASAAYLRRQQLDAVADGAALAGADGIQGEQVYEEGLGDTAEIDPAVARRYVAEYLAQVGAFRRYPGLTYRVGTTLDSVEVTISTPLRLPFAPPGWAEQTRVSGFAASLVRVLD
jgi:Putative Flp pilus-assembly TadE/G-like